jgi:hypothetical protein
MRREKSAGARMTTQTIPLYVERSNDDENLAPIGIGNFHKTVKRDVADPYLVDAAAFAAFRQQTTSAVSDYTKVPSPLNH